MSSSSQWRGKAIIPIHFSAIIFNKTDLQTLKISSKFTRTYGGGLLNPMFLKPPDGTKWEVNWTRKNDEEVWFQKGWNKFTENYSLDHGHLIVFTYHGNSQLDVHIFDKSASEILYPGLKLNTTPTTACDDEKNIKLDLMHNDDDDDSIEILKPCKHKRSMLVLVPQPCNKRMKDEKKKVAERRSSCSSLNWPKQERAQEVAMNFVSHNPFFTMFITHIHLTQYKAGVPNMKEYTDEDEKDVELKIGEKSWKVKLRRGSNSSNCRYLGGGWSLFADESELLPGDKIPDKFALKYGSGLSNPVFLKPPDGIRWKVCLRKKNDQVWFEKGWKEFTQKYSLDHGCLVLFKYEGTTSQFDVIIIDDDALEIDYSSYNGNDNDDVSVQIVKEIHPYKKNKETIRDEKNVTTSLSLNWPREPRARQEANKFVSNNPFFTVLIKPPHITEYRLCIPGLEGYVDNGVKNVKLEYGDRSWPVKMLNCNKTYSNRFLSAGWNLFAQENELKPGDVCVFELVNMQDLVFKVHVFAAHHA
ncbi:putative B3 domain-containing protein Os03g0621600 [Arachis stenosperma]|uniref:putative B3 domain-containing protein Os03g0621600 n=1 Tax=Arachis stenosperma TaxID=217475 RepID=UPI0025AC6285|nr:putative B3 domain-containing protein Os03g0621600 [Arachis stenosperma]